MSSDGTWGIISTIKGSKRQIEEFIKYYLSQGAGMILLYFDDINCEFIDEISNKYDRVRCKLCDSGHWNSLRLKEFDLDSKILANLSHGKSILRENNIEWGICVDLDEFIYSVSGVSIRDILKTLDKNIGCAIVRTWESVVTDDMHKDLFFKSVWFKKRLDENDSKFKIFLYKKLRSNIASFANDQLFFGHYCGKAFFRNELDFEKVGHHRPILKSGKYKYLEDFKDLKLLHYDSIEFSEWKNRWFWRVSGETVSKTMISKRLKQFDLVKKNINDEKKLKEIYKRFFYLNKLEILIFSFLNQIEKIDISHHIKDNRYEK